MKRTDFKENSSVFFIGKGVVIIAILITSSLSFTLGYFVGKSFQPPVVNQTSVITQQDSAEQKNAEPDKKESDAQQPEQTQKPQETQQTVKAQQAQETQKTQITKETKQTKETQETTKTRKYTVQAGAFKDASDANALKARLDKKGYKTFVTIVETKRHKNLYKVMIGDFADKKEAEVLSIKIKKAEGLKTFVTFKIDKEDLR